MTNLPLRVLFLISACAGSRFLAAQAPIDLPDPALEPQPLLIVLSGIAAEGGDGAFRTFFLSAEHPFGPYHHAGIQYTSYLPETSDYYYGENLLPGSYEIGLFSKFFIHGRLSGRRSHVYFGPQLRFSQRKMSSSYDPYYGNGTPNFYRVSTNKFLFCLGGQYQLGHAILEWTLPLGLEYARTISTSNPGNNYSDVHLSTAPGIALGIRL